MIDLRAGSACDFEPPCVSARRFSPRELPRKIRNRRATSARSLGGRAGALRRRIGGSAGETALSCARGREGERKMRFARLRVTRRTQSRAKAAITHAVHNTRKELQVL